MYIQKNKMDTLMQWTVFVVALLLIVHVEQTEGGECCRSYMDGLGRYHSQQWCPVFCCGFATLGKLDCCTDFAKRSFDGNRDGFCSSWFAYSHNIWAPIMIGFIMLAILIASCVCCIRCCFFI